MLVRGCYIFGHISHGARHRPKITISYTAYVLISPSILAIDKSVHLPSKVSERSTRGDTHNSTSRRTMMEPGTPGFGGGGGSSLPPPLQPLEVHITKWRRKYQQTLDKLTPHMYQRWAGTAGLIGLFVLRIVFSQGVSGFFPAGWFQARD